MENVNVLLVEDEAIVALDLASGLENDGYNVVGTVDNSDDAIEMFSQHDVDIVLMDINIIGKKDGIETAIELLKVKNVPIIYLTAFTDSATIQRVKQTHPAAFLTKPYNISNVRIAIELALNNFAFSKPDQAEATVIPLPQTNGNATNHSADKEPILQLNGYIFVKHNYHFIKFGLDDLLYLEADNNYVNIVTKTKKIALRLSLNQVLHKIQFKQLARIHRSFAVNINSIESFNEHQVVINKIELPIGRNYRDEFLQRFNFS